MAEESTFSTTSLHWNKLADHSSNEPVTLYKPRPTYRLVSGSRAFLDFELKSPARVDLSVLDSHNTVIRDYKNVPGRPGLNRRTWDMRYDPPRLVKLRTNAPDNPFIWEETRFRRADSRPITHWGIQQAEVGPVVPPGKYTVRLTVGGKAYTQPLEIVRAPQIKTTDAELEASVKMQLRIRDDINAVSDMVNQIEWMRKQMDDVQKMMRAETPKADLLKSVQAMDQKMQGVEYKLISKVEANSDDKYYVEPYKIYLNLIWLNGEVGTGAGDVAGSANYGPTDTSAGHPRHHRKGPRRRPQRLSSLDGQRRPAFNRAMVSGGVTPLSAGTPTPVAAPATHRN